MIFLLLFLLPATASASNKVVATKNIHDYLFTDFKVNPLNNDNSVNQSKEPVGIRGQQREKPGNQSNDDFLSQFCTHEENNKRNFNQLKSMALALETKKQELEKKVTSLEKFNDLFKNNVKQKSLASEPKRSRASSLISIPAIKNVQHQFSSEFLAIQETKNNNQQLQKENERLKQENQVIKKLKEKKGNNFKRLEEQIKTLRKEKEEARKEKEEALRNVTLASENKVELEEVLQNLQMKFQEEEKKNIEFQGSLEKIKKDLNEKEEELEKKEEEFNQLIKNNVEDTQYLKEQLFLNSQLGSNKKINLKRSRSLSQNTSIGKENKSQEDLKVKVFGQEQELIKLKKQLEAEKEKAKKTNVKLQKELEAEKEKFKQANVKLQKELEAEKEKVKQQYAQKFNRVVKVLTVIAAVVSGVGIVQAGLLSHPRVVNLFSKIKGLIPSVSYPSWRFSMPQVSVAMPQVSSPLPWILGKIAGLRARFN